MKLLLFGTGSVASSVMEKCNFAKTKINVIGFLDNDEAKYGSSFYGKNVYHPGQIGSLEYVYICILLVKGYNEVINQLVYGYNVSPNRIIDRKNLLKLLMIDKYKNDKRLFVKETIDYWKTHDISFMNQYQYDNVHYDQVFWDYEENMPYVIFSGKRLYYPRDYKRFIIKNEKMYAISYREIEQHELSPHRYLKGNIRIHEGDVVIDAGAQEGDFALPYIDIIGKLYLFECDLSWVKALKMTYKKYADKVTIIPKMLSNSCDEKSITLQEAVQSGKVDFIKMDIEGAEVESLLAAQELLKKNDIRCAVCTYHKKDDAEKIKSILKQNGYQSFFSNGYVVFVDDTDIFKDLDFRKAIIYGYK